MSLLKLPKRYQPGFRVPGVKPIGPVEVDWGNPLTRQLKALYYPQDNLLLDLVSGRRPSSTTGTPTFAVDRDGYHLNLDGASYYEYTNEAVSSQPLTVIAVFKTTDTSNFDAIWSIGNNSFDEFAFGVAANLAGDPIYFHARSGTSEATFGGTVISDKLHIGAATIDSSLLMTSFLDGVNVDTTTTAVTPTSTLERIGGRGASGAPNKYGGKLYSLAVFEGALSSAMVATISKNFYQLVAPANQQYYFPAAAGGLTISPAEIDSVNSFDITEVLVPPVISFTPIDSANAFNITQVTHPELITLSPFDSVNDIPSPAITMEQIIFLSTIDSINTFSIAKIEGGAILRKSSILPSSINAGSFFATRTTSIGDADA